MERIYPWQKAILGENEEERFENSCRGIRFKSGGLHSLRRHGGPV